MELVNADKSKRSECARHRVGECGVCSDKTLIDYYKHILGPDTPQSDDEIVNLVKSKLGVRYESEIFRHPSIVSNLGHKECKKVLKKYFKAEGPRFGDDLLNNFNIDDTLEMLSSNSEQLFGRKFKHIGFQMIDFQDTYGELNNLNLDELMSQGYDSMACVLNTDVSSGRGKHWFCIFSDLANKNAGKYVIELFNSSGNGPQDQLISWINTLNQRHPCTIKLALSRRLQSSRTECGVWCLAYIYWKLRGQDNQTFEKYMTDKVMLELRNFLFR